MAKNVQQIRGTTANQDLYVGLLGQFTVDVDRMEVRIHDGVTPGGFRIPNLDALTLIFMQKLSEFGNVAFDETSVGILTRIADKTYALRVLAAGNGITITNANGVDGNPTISITDVYITNLIRGAKAGILTHLGTTAGTDTTFTAVAPEGWPNVLHAFGVINFHAVPAAAGATIRFDAAWDALPLKNSDGDVDLSKVIRVGDSVFILRMIDHYMILGRYNAADIKIAAIAGMTATDVQAALLELKTGLTSSGDGIAGYQSFGDLSSTQGPFTPTKLAVNNNEGRLVFYNFIERIISTYTSAAPSPQENNPTYAAIRRVVQAFIIFRFEDKYYKSPIYSDATPSLVVPTERADSLGALNNRYTKDSKYKLSDALEYMGTSFSEGTKDYMVFYSDKRTVL
jgi:hypothetical protein